MTVTISVTRADNTAEDLVFSESAVVDIGRHPSCLCRLDGDPSVSRKHATLIIEPPHIYLRDNGSTNGVEINDRKYGGESGGSAGDRVELRHGDVVRIGKSAFFIRLDGAGADQDDDPDFVKPRIPGYDIVNVLGTGAMGAVFFGKRQSDGAEVAVKVILPHGAADSRHHALFKREIDVCTSIAHPNIVTFHDAGVTDAGVAYLVLEYVGGGNLRDLLAKSDGGKLPYEQSRRLIRQIAEGMAFAHGKGLIHRDIKPQNILLTAPNGNAAAKIADLGLAKNFEDSGMSGLTASYAGGGTMAYMPPEQLTGFRDVRPASDVFSVGATFYEMLSGLVPYNFGKDRDVMDVIAEGQIVPIADRAPGIPARIREIVDRCLAPEPDERYRDCGELVKALDAAP